MVKFSSAVLLALGTSAMAMPLGAKKAARSVAKKGIAYTSAAFTNSYTGAASWCWNWDTKTNGPIPQGMEFVPNLHDAASAAAFALAAPSAQHVLSFNEIDQCGGGGVCMDPVTAARLHKQYMAPLAGKVKIGSPSVTSDKSRGWPALKTWKENCGNDCPVNFLQLHWYGSGSGNAEKEANDLVQYIKDSAAELQGHFGSMPIWLTEFAPYYIVNQISAQQHIDFIRAAIPKLEALDIVERYSYFAAMEGFLNNADNSLTAAGKAYVS